MKIKVTLNGTNKNPYHKWGLTQNPFPQVAKYDYAKHLLQLQKLGTDPIPDTNYIKKVLKGWSPEFIELCCGVFQKGKIVEFYVTFKEEN